MVSVLESGLIINTIGLFVVFLISALAYIKWSHQYWHNRRVPFIKPKIPFGNVEPPYNRNHHFGIYLKEMYDKVKSRGHKYYGLYFIATPVICIFDLDLLKHVMSKDFDYFQDRGTYVNERDDPIGAHLVSLSGSKWRTLRTKLSPAFTSGRMRAMFQNLVECGAQLEQSMMLRQRKNGIAGIDIKELFGCYTTDVMGSYVFGLDCKSIQDESSPFRVYGKKVFATSIRNYLVFIFTVNFPNVARFLRIKQVPKDIGDFFMKMVRDSVEYRERNRSFSRKDFLQVLIDIRNGNNGDGGKELTVEEIAAQCLVFFLAGFESSATLMTFIMYELANNQDIQKKARAEITSVLNEKQHNGEITYDSITDMKYMNQIIDEGLRKYPSIPFVKRVCVKDYKIPDGKNIVIEKDTQVLIPIYGIHRDPEFYPDPERFDPDRFTEENKQMRPRYAYLPFGEGPRNCIALRMGLMQAKVALVVLLKNYRFSVNPRTKSDFRMLPTSFILTAEDGLWLDAHKL